jgi:hypothetical protein
MTDAEFAAWLTDPSARPTTLIEVAPLIAGVATPLYLATVGYTTGAADTPANTPYLGVCGTGIKPTEALSLDGSAALTVGDIEVHNYGGVRDTWLGYVWTNTPVAAWVGDVRWARADFRMVFNGLVANLDSKSREVLNIKIRDKLVRLNAAATEHKLGGTTSNKDEIIPLVFGEAFNITPLLTDPTTLEYQVHDGPIERIIEVRDNGLPVDAISVNLATGKFTLSQSSAGGVTASVQGDKPSTYANTIAATIQRLATGFGKSADRFTLAEIDTANFTAFDAAHPQPIGLPITDRTNVLAACQQLAASVGAQLLPSPTGQLRLYQISLPPAGTPTDILPSMMVEKSLKIAQRPDVVAAVKLGFCKNWTVQKDLQTALPAAHKDLMATEWRTETATDATVQATYKLTADPQQQDTLLLRRSDAAAEAARQRDLWKVQRTVYEFEALAPCLTLQLGDPVRLFNSRFNLGAGAVGIVLSRAPDWKTRRVTLQVLV